MVCEHLKALYKFLEDNEIEFNSLGIINFVCKKCKLKDSCVHIPIERIDELEK